MASLAESLHQREEIFPAACFFSQVAAPLPASLWNCQTFPSLSKHMAYSHCTCWHLGKSLLDSCFFFFTLLHSRSKPADPKFCTINTKKREWKFEWWRVKIKSSLEAFFIHSMCYSFSRLCFIWYWLSINQCQSSEADWLVRS